jgi:hypothetical protein
MNGEVLILRWNGSAYDSLGGLLSLYAEEFRALGHAPRFLDVDQEAWPDTLAAIMAEGPPLLALTMSGIGVDFEIEGQCLWERIGVPLFNWNCDHPAYFPERHLTKSPYVINGYVFPDHAAYAAAHANATGVAFCVHMGAPARTLFEGAPKPLSARNGRILFAKSGADTNTIQERWRALPQPVQTLLFTGAEALFHASTAEFLPVLQGIGADGGMFLSGSGRLTLTLLQELDAFIRFKRAALLVETVRRYPVDIFGAGWDHLRREGDAATFFGPSPFAKMMRSLPGYLGCLSMNPLIDGSLHDRAFFAVSAGVAPISDANAFARARLPSLEPLTYRFEKSSIETAVEHLLGDPEGALERTERAYEALYPEITFRRAAQNIAAFAPSTCALRPKGYLRRRGVRGDGDDKGFKSDAPRRG